jgi:hypothetical protein
MCILTLSRQTQRPASCSIAKRPDGSRQASGALKVAMDAPTAVYDRLTVEEMATDGTGDGGSLGDEVDDGVWSLEFGVSEFRRIVTCLGDQKLTLA